MENASPGKIERLAYICGLLGRANCPPEVHYQLLHRTASALIEADRFAATHAVMLVHSFSPTRRWFDAFQRFALFFDQKVVTDQPVRIDVPSGKSLHIGWCTGDPSFLAM